MKILGACYATKEKTIPVKSLIFIFRQEILSWCLNVSVKKSDNKKTKISNVTTELTHKILGEQILFQLPLQQLQDSNWKRIPADRYILIQ